MYAFCANKHFDTAVNFYHRAILIWGIEAWLGSVKQKKLGDQGYSRSNVIWQGGTVFFENVAGGLRGIAIAYPLAT